MIFEIVSFYCTAYTCYYILSYRLLLMVLLSSNYAYSNRFCTTYFWIYDINPIAGSLFCPRASKRWIKIQRSSLNSARMYYICVIYLYLPVKYLFSKYLWRALFRLLVFKNVENVIEKVFNDLLCEKFVCGN